MKLYIDTADKNFLELSLEDKNKIIARRKIKTNFDQAEKLWPSLDKLLKSRKINPRQLEKIVVNNLGGSFTSLHIGIAIANALAFAWGVPAEDPQGGSKKIGGLQIVEPAYNRELKLG